MKEILRKLLRGWIIWVLPFVVSFLVWDIESNTPRISPEMFNALMSVCLIIGLSIALYLFFKDHELRNKKEGLKIGIIWYVELLVLDLIVLVGMLQMSYSDYSVLFLSYTPVIIVSGFIGYLYEN